MTPTWVMNVTAKGMVLEREGQPPLAVPFVEEQLGDGRFNLRPKPTTCTSNCG